MSLGYLSLDREEEHNESSANSFTAHAGFVFPTGLLCCCDVVTELLHQPLNCWGLADGTSYTNLPSLRLRP